MAKQATSAKKVRDNIIRFRGTPALRAKIKRIAKAMTNAQPKGSKALTSSDVLRIALHEMEAKQAATKSEITA